MVHGGDRDTVREMKLGDFKGRYLVLLFYPLDFTYVCPTEILAFNDRIAEFREVNAEVSERKIRHVASIIPM